METRTRSGTYFFVIRFLQSWVFCIFMHLFTAVCKVPPPQARFHIFIEQSVLRKNTVPETGIYPVGFFFDFRYRITHTTAQQSHTMAQMIRKTLGNPYARSTNTWIFHTTAQTQFKIMAAHTLTVFCLSIAVPPVLWNDIDCAQSETILLFSFCH